MVIHLQFDLDTGKLIEVKDKDKKQEEETQNTES